MSGDGREKVPSEKQRFIVAGAFAALVGGIFAWAVTTAWHPVRPRLVCVMPLANGQTAAWFGYVNERDADVTLPIGEDNSMSPGEPGRGQPVRFAAKVAIGTKDKAFAVAFAGRELKWILDGREAVATPDSPRCAMPPPIKVNEDIAWMKPEPAKPPDPPKPPEPEKPPEKKPEPEKPPPPEKEAPKPKLGTTAPRVRSPRPVPPKTVTAPEPVPLAVADLTNLATGIVVQGGEETSLGDPEVEATKTNTKPQPTGDPDGDPQGVVDATGPARVVRTPPKVKVRPRGEWPADAPPRAGAVLVKLSLRVGEDGKVKEVRVVKGAGAAFDREAKKVGLQAEFSPATENGVAVSQWVPWVVEFSPEDD